MNLRTLLCLMSSLLLWQACGENQNEHPVRLLFPDLSSHTDLTALARSIEVSLTPGKGTCLQKEIFATYRAKNDDPALTVVRVQLQSEIIPEGKSLSLSAEDKDKIAANTWLHSHSELLEPISFSAPNQASDFTLGGYFYEPRDRNGDGYCDEELKNGSGVNNFSMKAVPSETSSPLKNDIEFKLSVGTADQLPATWSPIKFEILSERPVNLLELESLYGLSEENHLHYHVPVSLAHSAVSVPGSGKLKVHFQSDLGVHFIEINDLSPGVHATPFFDYKVSPLP